MTPNRVLRFALDNWVFGRDQAVQVVASLDDSAPDTLVELAARAVVLALSDASLEKMVGLATIPVPVIDRVVASVDFPAGDARARFLSLRVGGVPGATRRARWQEAFETIVRLHARPIASSSLRKDVQLVSEQAEIADAIVQAIALADVRGKGFKLSHFSTAFAGVAVRRGSEQARAALQWIAQAADKIGTVWTLKISKLTPRSHRAAITAWLERALG